MNLLLFVQNDPSDSVDLLGMAPCPRFCCYDWKPAYALSGFCSIESCVEDTLADTIYGGAFKRWLMSLAVNVVGTATCAINAGALARAGGPAAAAGLIFSAGDFLAGQAALLAAYNQCTREHCVESGRSVCYCTQVVALGWTIFQCKCPRRNGDLVYSATADRPYGAIGTVPPTGWCSEWGWRVEPEP